MSSLLHFLIFAKALCFAFASSKAHSHNKTTCQEYTHGLTFNDSQAFGNWHLLHYSTDKSNGTERESRCIQFSPVSEQERKELSDLIGKYVENMKWESLTLKMQIPCSIVKTTHIRDYFLERLDGDGSYRSLQKPPPSAKLDLVEFHRYPMRLKIVEGQYLGMMDCRQKFAFLLGREPPNGSELDERLKKMIHIYWPEEETTSN